MNTKEFLKSLLNEYAPKDKDIKKIIAIISDEEKIGGDYKSTPGIPNLKLISHTGEPALQRAIFNKEQTILSDTKEVIEWLDLEIPVTLSKKSRRNCADLLGKSEDKLILAELKYRNSSETDSPYYGIFELAVYYYLLTQNYVILDKYKVYHKKMPIDSNQFSWNKYIPLNKTGLIFVANKKYFDYWIGEKKTDINDLHALLKRISDKFNISYDIYYTCDENFKMQKGDNKNYEPKISNIYWEKI